jgi:hypothetical protein
MTIAPALRKIEADIRKALAEPELDREAIELAARHIGTQAEMVELGLDTVGLSQ